MFLHDFQTVTEQNETRTLLTFSSQLSISLVWNQEAPNSHTFAHQNIQVFLEFKKMT